MSTGIYPIPPRPPLTESERQEPYASFYDLPIQDPPDEILNTLLPGHPMDSADSIGFHQLEQFFLPGGLDKIGYCIRPDGIGYIHMRLHLPDVTPKMRTFFYSHWLDAHPLHYKIWLPGLHIDHTKPFTESFGWGQGRVCFRQEIIPLNASPENYHQLGLSASPQELDPLFLSVAASSADFIPLDPAAPGFTNTNVGIYKSDGAQGLIAQVVSWFGMYVENGRPVRVLPAGASFDLEMARLYACHQAYEMTRLNDILPQIYQLHCSRAVL